MKSSRDGLDALFTASPAGEIPSGEAKGASIVAPTAGPGGLRMISKTLLRITARRA